MTARRDDDAERKRESERILARVAREAETVGRSNLARQIEQRLFRTEGSDPVERWGRIIGRTLGFLFLLYLVWHLATTYILA